MFAVSYDVVLGCSDNISETFADNVMYASDADMPSEGNNGSVDNIKYITLKMVWAR